MSNREKCIALIDSVPESKIGYVLAYLQGITADESDDDAFCEELYKKYETDPDKGDFVSLEALAAELGVSL